MSARRRRRRTGGFSKHWLFTIILGPLLVGLVLIWVTLRISDDGHGSSEKRSGGDFTRGECTDIQGRNSISTGWGPTRPTYLLSHPAPHPTLNAITDSHAWGDERAFVDARLTRDTAAGSYCNSLGVADGDIVTIRAYLENSAADNLVDADGLGEGLARDVSIAFVPDKERSTLVRVWAQVTSSTTDPATVWDSVEFISDTPFRLDYLNGSGVVYSNLHPDSQPLDLGVWDGPGVLVGPRTLDGNLPPGYEYEMLVEVEARVTAVS